MESLYKNRWKILCVVLLGPFMATIDSSIVNIALPVMANKLNSEIDQIQWVVNSYLITISALVIIFGKIADKMGKALIFQYGFLIFLIGSLLCGVSINLTMLVLSRVVQGIGASMFMSSNQGIIAQVFPMEERGTALGFSGTTVAVGTMLGPPIGGILVEFFNWQSIFLINIPIALFGYIIGRKILPKKHHIIKGEDFDVKGSILFIIFITSLFFSMLNGEKMGWLNIYILLSFTLSIFSITLFYYIEKNSQEPILDFSLFKNKLFNLSIFCAFISFAVIFSNNIIQPFYLQYLLDVSPSKAGMLMMIFPISAAICAPLSGYACNKIGAEIITFFGVLITTIALFYMAFLNNKSSFLSIGIRIALLGIGNGMFQAPNNSIVMSLASKDKLGATGSINALIRNMGMVFGIGFSVSLFYNRMSYKVGHKVANFNEGGSGAFIYSMNIVYMVSGFLAFIALSFTALRLIKKKKGILN